MTEAKSLKDDIAFMKDLAEAGASTPLLGGRISIFFGGVFAALSVAQWVLITYVRPADWVYSVLWLGTSLASWVAWWFLVGDLRRRPGARSPTNRAAGWAWMAMGVGSAVILGSAMLVSWRLHTSAPFALIPSIIITLYGGAWLVAGLMSRQGWMLAVAVGSFAYALFLAFFITSAFLWLMFALALILFGVIPGIIMVRREPSLVV